MEAEFFEQRAGGNHAFDVFLGTARQFQQGWGKAQHVPPRFAGNVEGLAGGQAGEDVVEGTDRR